MQSKQDSLRHGGMIGFVAISLLVTMSIGQLEPLPRASFRYWLVICSALCLPLLDLMAIIATLFGRASLLLLFLIWSGSWHLITGDSWATFQLGAFILVLAWTSIPAARILVKDLIRLYGAMIMIGVLVLCFSKLNGYGLIPGFSDDYLGKWRVSFFPNIGFTGATSLVVLLVLSRTRADAWRYSLIFGIATYFLIFSHVRGIHVAIVMYAALYYYFLRAEVARPNRLFWIALLVAFGVPFAVYWSADVLYLLQNNTAVSVVLLRNRTNLSVDEILYQLYRPWLWGAHLQLFFSSPSWMGWGSSEFYQAALDATNPPQTTTGSESMPTRLLASYGFPSLLFVFYLVRLLRELANKGDRWACACFPAIFFLMVNWGSFFHPTDAMFVLFMLIVTRGSDGFVRDGSVQSVAQNQQSAF